ncbi:hypothetical protein RRG08_048279 [Elysia crispata]|uniref:Uncharacterized protein n=1 Tax=Elysia crispata TaxID=231223 RepID=A0AAE0ZT49_9GAST|nr:hypothetical protein RRG08_048279 [Elysia crispata]
MLWRTGYLDHSVPFDPLYSREERWEALDRTPPGQKGHRSLFSGGFVMLALGRATLTELLLYFLPPGRYFCLELYGDLLSIALQY